MVTGSQSTLRVLSAVGRQPDPSPLSDSIGSLAGPELVTRRIRPTRLLQVGFRYRLGLRGSRPDWSPAGVLRRHVSRTNHDTPTWCTPN
jgi:hypothetical protein